VDGLEGESDGREAGDVDPAALHDGTMGVAPLDQQDDADAEVLQEEVTGTHEGAADTDEGRIPLARARQQDRSASAGPEARSRPADGLSSC